MRRFRTGLVLALTLILFATACGGETSDEVVAGTVEDVSAAAAGSAAGGEGSGDGGQEATDDSDDNDDDDNSSEGEPQTLAELLGPRAGLLTGQRGGGNFDEQAQIEQQRLIQETIRDCMLNQGFEYAMEEANVGGPRAIFASLRDVGADLPGDEYAETYGFGVSTVFDVLLEDGAAAFGVGEDEVDANQELVDAMSEGEADAWETALNGEPPERDAEGRPIDPETGEVIEAGRGRGGFQQGGCRGDAQSEVRGDFTALLELSDEFEQLEARIEADPRLDEISREWSACMSDAGYSFDSTDEARAEITGEFRPMVAQVFGFGPGGRQGEGRNGADLSSTGMTEEQATALAALQDKERSIATADYSCGNEYVDEIAEIRTRYEAEFIDANRDALQAAVAG